MCWLKKKNKQIIPAYKKQETPPEAPISDDAVAVIWNEDKKSYGEVLFSKGVYKYECWQLCYDEDFVGYYWTPIYSKSASFFDTLEKAKQAAEEILKDY